MKDWLVDYVWLRSEKQDGAGDRMDERERGRAQLL